MVDSSIIVLASVLAIVFAIALGWLTLVSRKKWGGGSEPGMPGLNPCAEAAYPTPRAARLIARQSTAIVKTAEKRGAPPCGTPTTSSPPKEP